MSNSLYPAVKGLTLPVRRTEEWLTIKQTTVSGKDVNLTLWQNPIHHWELIYSYLPDLGTPPTAFRTIRNFFNARQGMFDSFLFNDVDDNSVTDEPFGTGDGNTLTFNLQRHDISGGYSEWIQNVNVLTNVKVNAVVTSVTLNSIGQVTFTTAPALGTALTWTGTYFFRVRFENDSQDFEKFMNQLWEVKSVKIKSVKL